MRCIIALLTIYFVSAIPVAAAERFSLYTDACYNVEGGDLLGYRIGILRLSDAPYVFFQEASGDWSAPSVVKVSADELKRGKLTFTISNGGKPFGFRGTITEKAVTGRFDGLFDDKGKPLAVRLRRISPSIKGALNCR